MYFILSTFLSIFSQPILYMKKAFLPVLLFISACFAISACSNGDYIATPGTNANGSVNPLRPLKPEEFNWAGAGNFSVKINGGGLISTDSAWWFIDTSGANRVVAFINGSGYFNFYLKDTYAGNLYNMGFEQYNTSAQFLGPVDSGTVFFDYYESARGNSGGLWMLTNDSLTFSGKFYCQMVNSKGNVVNLSEGTFAMSKF